MAAKPVTSRPRKGSVAVSADVATPTSSAERGRDSAQAVRRQDSQREHNLALLLGQLHRDGHVTRAELTARLGLNRSTVLALVAELSRRGILTEEEDDAPSARGGRRSFIVRPAAECPYVFSVGVTVSTVTIMSYGIGGTIGDRREVVLSGNSPAKVARIISEHIRDGISRRARSVCLGVGVSIPGWLSPDGDIVAYNPNLRWNFISFADKLSRALRKFEIYTPVSTGNDANLGAMAERARGHNRDCDNLIYLLGRAGIGAGVVSSGVLMTGHSGAAGELGHISLDPNGPRCHCGRRGCVEVYLGDAAILRQAAEAGLHCDTVRAVFDAAVDGNGPAQTAVTAMAGHLGQALAMLVNLFDPEVIVAAGTLARVLEIDRAAVDKALSYHALANSLAGMEVQSARDGASESTLIGAGEMAFRSFLSAPLEIYDAIVAR